MTHWEVASSVHHEAQLALLLLLRDVVLPQRGLQEPQYLWPTEGPVHPRAQAGWPRRAGGVKVLDAASGLDRSGLERTVSIRQLHLCLSGLVDAAYHSF